MDSKRNDAASGVKNQTKATVLLPTVPPKYSSLPKGEPFNFPIDLDNLDVPDLIFQCAAQFKSRFVAFFLREYPQVSH